MEGRIHSIESFGASDGPGVRFIVFLEGCHLRCKYCHNPDTWAKPQDAQLMTPEALLKKSLRYRPYWGDLGGVTASGGEPLLQLDFLLEFFRLCKERDINTCIDTAAEPFTREQPWFGKFEELMKVTDLLLFDIKHIDSAAHQELTGRPNGNILDCARYLSDIGKPVWIRHVLVPGVNTDPDVLRRTGDFLRTLKNVERIDVLPYHTLGVFKWDALKIPYQLKGVEPPTDEQVAAAKQALGA